MSGARLSARGLTLAYGNRTIVHDLDIDVVPDGFTAIIGPNACGKSTLLKALARVLRPVSGEITLDGTPVRGMKSKAFARQLALLPQSPIAPETITVRELVARGRFPHQSLLRQWSDADGRAVEEALRLSSTVELADRLLSELSGGQRQRCWIAMVLAQETPLLLLDEPTTFLDIAHQYEVLELCSGLHEAGKTLVAVLHDLNQAARYATHLVVMKEGRIVAQGEPSLVLTAELVLEVFGLESTVIADPETGTPLVIPRRAGAARLSAR